MNDIAPVLRFLDFQVHQFGRVGFECILFIKLEMVGIQSASQIFDSYVMHLQDISGHWEQVCFLSPELKLNTEKLLSVFMGCVCGTNSQITARLCQPLLHSNQTLRLSIYYCQTVKLLPFEYGCFLEEN